MADLSALTVTLRTRFTDEAYFIWCDEMGWMVGGFLRDLPREYGKGWRPDDSRPWAPDDSRDV